MLVFLQNSYKNWVTLKNREPVTILYKAWEIQMLGRKIICDKPNLGGFKLRLSCFF